MEEGSAYLPYLINEPIYVIAEDSIKSQATVSSKEADLPSEPTQQREKETEEITLNPIVTFGENLKHCIVLFSAEGKISADSKALLFKILEAINRKPKDALMANVYGCSPEQLNALLAEHQHRHLISFGVRTIEPLAQSAVYAPIELKGKHYILSDHLEAVATDTDKKRALWKALKEVFH